VKVSWGTNHNHQQKETAYFVYGDITCVIQPNYKNNEPRNLLTFRKCLRSYDRVWQSVALAYWHQHSVSSYSERYIQLSFAIPSADLRVSLLIRIPSQYRGNLAPPAAHRCSLQTQGCNCVRTKRYRDAGDSSSSNPAADAGSNNT